jgi:hypothetical protein
MKKINLLCVLVLALTLVDIVMSLFFTSGKSATHIDFDTLSLGSLIGLLVLTLVILGAGVMTLVYFIKFILNVNRNQIFTEKNVSLLRKYGICTLLIGVGLIGFSLAVITGQSLTNAISDSITVLCEGFFALLMGEVFGIGLKLQERKSTAA